MSYLNLHPGGVGEIGLDRWIPDYDIDTQIKALRFQLTLARDLKRPTMIHCLHAWDLLLSELTRLTPFPHGLMIHGFGGSTEIAQQLLGLGATISVAGSVLDPKHTRPSGPPSDTFRSSSLGNGRSRHASSGGLSCDTSNEQPNHIP